MFNYDWFHNGGLERLVAEARDRCAARKFPTLDPSEREDDEDFQGYRAALDTRVILYMKDGLTYEMKELADVGSSSALTFECVPVDDNYRVGAIVLVLPFEDVARVEVFAVHPEEKPTENLRIPGFRAASHDGVREGP